MFKVLLPIDSNGQRAELATEAVLDLPCVDTEYRILILNIFQQIRASDSGGQYDSERYYDESDFPESVEAAVETLDARGIDHSMHRRHGEPAKEIIRFSEETDAQRIIMAGRRRSPTGKALFGSVAQQVLLKSEIPVTIVVD